MSLESILSEHRTGIIAECTHGIRKKCGQRYSQRSIKELAGTTPEITDANFAALVDNDFSKIDGFIRKITELRLYHESTLSEVQQAFELQRTSLFRLFGERFVGPELVTAMSKLNECLSYTIAKFTDYYQNLHQKKMREYTEILEQEVSKRTRQLSASEAKYRMLVPVLGPATSN